MKFARAAEFVARRQRSIAVTWIEMFGRPDQDQDDQDHDDQDHDDLDDLDDHDEHQDHQDHHNGIEN